MNRREFVGRSVIGVAGASGLIHIARAEEVPAYAASSGPFRLRYAPPLGCFKNLAGPDPIDQIKFMHDQGFRAVFDNGLIGRKPALQEKIAAALADRGMKMGPFVAEAEFKNRTMVLPPRSVKSQLTRKMEAALETAQRTQTRWILVVPGRYDESLEWDYQTANVIENLKTCAAVFEPHGFVMVIEPLNPLDHPGLFLTKISQAYQICRAVGSPACKIVNDLYHQQITEGNLTNNIDSAWDEIAAFHLGDVPGRQEPGSGEINFKNLFKHIHEKGYDGVLCMEHGLSRGGAEGEKRLIEAYRQCDGF